MADTVRAAVVQLLADEDSARNIARAGELVEAAAAAGAARYEDFLSSGNHF